MEEKLKNLQNKVKDFWNKYDKKQKKLIISITAAVIVALVIVIFVFTRPTYVELITCTDAKQAADVTSALTGENIGYTTENNGLKIMVEDKDLDNATYLIAQNGLTATAYTMESYINDGSFSTTSADRDRMYQKYLEDKMETTIEGFDYVKDANVQFTVPTKKLTVLEEDEDTYVAIVLNLKKSAPAGAIDAMAKYAATSVGNKTTNSITIVDTQGNSLFIGSSNYVDEEGGISIDERQAISDRFYNQITNNVSSVLSKTGLYSEISVAPALVIDYSQKDIVDTQYSNPDEVKQNDYIYEQEGGSYTGGVPGTDSNGDDTDYQINTSGSGSGSVSIKKNEYAVSSTITSTKGTRGTCDYKNSSLAVTVNDYIVYKEDTLKDNGTLDKTTWEEYIANNSEEQQMEIPADLIQAVSAASGIPVERITITGWKIPMFVDSEDDGSFVTNILPIIIAVIILGLLGFMVWRSLRPVEVNEVEPELSVEELLSATKEKQTVEDIDLEEKSETRKAIEKFVDDNPEAAALLLRNWLNDDWD